MIRFIPPHTGPLSAAALAFVVATTPATAQSDSIEAARTLVETITPESAATAQLEQRLREIRSGSGIRAMLSSNPRMRAELAKNSPATEAGLARMGKIQADALEPILREMQNSGRAVQAASFAELFTTAELREITAFYRSPAGAKLLATQGKVAAAVTSSNNEKFQTRLRSAEQAIAPQLDQELRKLFPAAAGK